MKSTKNLQEYVGKYVRFDMFGKHCAKIVGAIASQEDLILEFPMITTSFNIISDKEDLKKVQSIQKFHEIWHMFDVGYLEEVNEQDYKNHLFKLISQCSVVD